MSRSPDSARPRVDLIAKCKTHRRYRGVGRPRSSKKFPRGCGHCWAIRVVYLLDEIDKLERAKR